MMSKHAQELLDKKRNWAFTAYEELNSPQDQREKKLFGIKDYGEDGREKEKLSVMEEYYQSLDQGKASTPRQSAETARAEFINRNGFDPLGKSFDSSDPFTRKIFGVEKPVKADKDAEPGVLGEGGPNNLSLGSPAEIKFQQQRLEEVRETILGDFSRKFPRVGEQQNNPLNSLLPTDSNSSKKKTGVQTLLDQQLSDADAI